MSTLIVYATKHGTTGKCAAMLSKKLDGKVELFDLKEGRIPDINSYEKVIIGGSIYAGRIQKEITTFCSQNLNLLKNKRLGLFICCMLKNNTESQLNSAFPQELLNHAVAKESFGAEMRFSDMNFAEKLLTKMVVKTIAKNDASLSIMDMKKDMSMISEGTIEKFALSMNNI